MEPRATLLTRLPLLAAALATLLVGACNSGAGGTTQSGSPGAFKTKPGTGGTTEYYFSDRNQGGNATRLHLVEMTWGRLVDVYDIDPVTGKPGATPVLRDFVINENQPLNAAKAVLDINAITQQARLVIQRTVEAPEPSPGAGTFEDVLREMQASLPPIAPKNDDGSAPEPFSFIARNATLVLRFDDVLKDDASSQAALANTVKVLTGYAPNTPFTPRLLFDPAHGAVVDGKFHSTRILIDMTVSEAEAVSLGGGTPVNSIGLPASLEGTGQPNVSVRIPTRIDFASTQFEILRGLNGAQLATTGNGPVDFQSPTLDVVRAMRAGNAKDVNNGFLLDLAAPQVVGGFPLNVDTAVPLPGSTSPGFEFLIDMTFGSVCRERPLVGDILSIGNVFLEVSATAGPPDPMGVVRNLNVRSLNENPITNPSTLLGSGLFLTTYKPANASPNECYVSFAPQPAQLPATGVQPSSQILIRFTEPMDPASILPFDTFLVSKGTAANSAPDATNTVVASILPSADLREYVYTPVLPFEHVAGLSDAYNIQLVGGPSGVTDLAGNALLDSLPTVDFTIDAATTEEKTGNIVLRFNSTNEWTISDQGNNFLDLRGQFFYDLTEGVIRPRDAQRFPMEPADRTNPVPGLMIPFPPGVQTPLSPLGSKLQTVWRYCDFGWLVDDETKYNLDVEGLYWSPVGGQVISDFYEEFEIRLSHSLFLPDEWVNRNLLPQYPASGLVNPPNPYTDNILVDPLSGQDIVHNRALSYQVNPIDLAVTSQGTALLPFPLNRTPGVPPVRYLWRDTAALAVGGERSAGIPLAVEADIPLLLYGGLAPGFLYRTNEVPTIGLPLLMEFRCYPSNSGIGLNAFDINLAINSSARPNFRNFSTGGFNTSGMPVIKDPDLELIATGGFNPRSTPPGKKTRRASDNSFYNGAMDYVVRVSRVHSVWLDTGNSNPDYFTPIVEPNPSAQPAGTAVLVDFRGATGFTPGSSGGIEQFDASELDAYGNTSWRATAPTVTFFNGDDTWSSDINQVDGAKFLQLRFSFINNVDTMLEPELSAIGVAYKKR